MTAECLQPVAQRLCTFVPAGKLLFSYPIVYMLYYFLAGKTFDVVAHNQIYWVNRHRRERVGIRGLQVVFLSRRLDV
jgi:hypothetical protein